MPYRRTPLVEGQIYHVFNRGINRQHTYTDKRTYQRFMLAMRYYRYWNEGVKLSRFITMDIDSQQRLIARQTPTTQRVDTLSFCLMPNHYHILLKQTATNGISDYISNLENSYTRYFNIKNHKQGPLFLPQFKAVRVENFDQLLHVSRYIHLNPLTSYLVNDIESLSQYPWSSLLEYVNGQPGAISNPVTILSSFKSAADYLQFVFDRSQAQRKLHTLAHIFLDVEGDQFQEQAI